MYMYNAEDTDLPKPNTYCLYTLYMFTVPSARLPLPTRINILTSDTFLSTYGPGMSTNLHESGGQHPVDRAKSHDRIDRNG